MSEERVTITMKVKIDVIPDWNRRYITTDLGISSDAEMAEARKNTLLALLHRGVSTAALREVSKVVEVNGLRVIGVSVSEPGVSEYLLVTFDSPAAKDAPVQVDAADEPGDGPLNCPLCEFDVRESTRCSVAGCPSGWYYRKQAGVQGDKPRGSATGDDLHGDVAEPSDSEHGGAGQGVGTGAD